MKNAKQTVKIISLITIIVTAILFIVLLFQSAKIITLRNKQKQLNKTIAKTQEEIVEYDKLLDYIDYQNGEYSQEFLEDYAREVYGWGKTDRKYYVGQ